MVVVADPGHKDVQTPADVRLELARAAFPGDEVVLDDHARTIDMLRAHPEWHGRSFLLGADEFADFRPWKEPEEVLRLVQLGVATRGPARHPVDGALRSRALLRPRPSLSPRARCAPGSTGARTFAIVIPQPSGKSIERDGLYGRRPATLSPLDVTRTSTPHRGARTREARERRRHPGHAAGVQLHRLLRDRDREQHAPDEGDPGRGTDALKQDGRSGCRRRSRARSEATWIVADYLDVVLHVFTPDARDFYRLDDLWGDVPQETLEAASRLRNVVCLGHSCPPCSVT